MKKEISNKLRPIISQERIRGYEKRILKKFSPVTELDCYVYYNWNTALSQSFYASLQTLEIALRNSIHNNASKHFNDSKWFENPKILDQESRKRINTAKMNLQKQKKNLSAGRILAELSFGFWTSLFNKKYDQILWHKIIKKSFPCMDAQIRTRKTLSARLNKIRRLRNRIFHYEPIWYYYDLNQHHENILETIAWIEPKMRDMVLSIDQFPSCIKQEKINNIKSGLQKTFSSETI